MTSTLTDMNRTNLGHHWQRIRRRSTGSLPCTPRTTGNVQNLEDELQCHFTKEGTGSHLPRWLPPRLPTRAAPRTWRDRRCTPTRHQEPRKYWISFLKHIDSGTTKYLNGNLTTSGQSTLADLILRMLVINKGTKHPKGTSAPAKPPHILEAPW